MKAIMYGAGNIGRGFIAERFYLSGYETVFIDVNAQMVDAINEAREYPIYVTMGSEYVPTQIKNVRAVNGRDEAAAIAEIATADIMATALGANILPFVAPLMAKAITARKRKKAGFCLVCLVCSISAPYRCESRPRESIQWITWEAKPWLQLAWEATSSHRVPVVSAM